jgi:hypothetical protein
VLQSCPASIVLPAGSSVCLQARMLSTMQPVLCHNNSADVRHLHTMLACCLR